MFVREVFGGTGRGGGLILTPHFYFSFKKKKLNLFLVNETFFFGGGGAISLEKSVVFSTIEIKNLIRTYEKLHC